MFGRYKFLYTMERQGGSYHGVPKLKLFDTQSNAPQVIVEGAEARSVHTQILLVPEEDRPNYVEQLYKAGMSMAPASEEATAS